VFLIESRTAASNCEKDLLWGFLVFFEDTRLRPEPFRVDVRVGM
jgi:hypothetical protein